VNWLEVGVLFALGLAVVDGFLIALLARTPGDDPRSGTRHGLPLGAALPAFMAQALDGSAVSHDHARGRLLLFLGSACHACDPLVSELAAAESRDRALLLIVVVDPIPSASESILESLAFMPPARVVHDPARTIADRVAMPGLPFVYAVDTGGRIRAKHGVPSLERLRSLARFAGV
jgi:hypothetical protein